ncbi:MAG: group II intron reverse transcriptase/maturase [Planctomycetes bacterium]|nr:group II intron reverse transcriptase/maturase [Planctomycetota bacterium]
MATDLTRVGERARRSPGLVFTSLYHHVTDVDNLRASYAALEANKATGVDGVTKAAYGRDLDENLSDLSQRLRNLSYRPQDKRRAYIPKPGSPKGRPLGISCLEDKIVERAVKQVLEPIYETVFLDSSHGYRPEHSQHGCLAVLGRTIQQQRVSHVVEADIRGFFDTVNHEWLMKFLEHRIGDPRLLRVIRRMLKAGIMEDGLTQTTTQGTPQGSILSPLLSNVYLHYVLDLWFAKRVQPQCRGGAWLFRFADDFVACFQHSDEATQFVTDLTTRLEQFGLALALDKTRCIAFGRFARDKARRSGRKPAEFTFLGFTHYCGKTGHGYFKVKRRTGRKKFRLSLARFTEWARKSRGLLSTGQMLDAARRRILGHLQYYAVTDNTKDCETYVHHATNILFKWLNRRSQRRTYTWDSYYQALQAFGWPTARVRVDLNPCYSAAFSK